jgi:hypothetical protein
VIWLRLSPPFTHDVGLRHRELFATSRPRGHPLVAILHELVPMVREIVVAHASLLRTVLVTSKRRAFQRIPHGFGRALARTHDRSSSPSGVTIGSSTTHPASGASVFPPRAEDPSGSGHGGARTIADRLGVHLTCLSTARQPGCEDLVPHLSAPEVSTRAGHALPPGCTLPVVTLLGTTNVNHTSHLDACASQSKL